MEVQLESFSGPLDLLLELAATEKMDITTVSLAALTDQYVAKLDELKFGYSLAELTEYVAVAAELLYIKSRFLLREPIEEEEPSDLEARLAEYKKYKEATALFAALLTSGRRSMGRQSKPIQIQTFVPPEGLRLDRLVALFTEITNRLPEEPAEEAVTIERVNIKDVEGGLRAQIKQHGRLPFGSLFAAAATRLQAVVMFLALLELIKQQEVTVAQDGLFDEIYVTAA